FPRREAACSSCCIRAIWTPRLKPCATRARKSCKSPTASPAGAAFISSTPTASNSRCGPNEPAHRQRLSQQACTLTPAWQILKRHALIHAHVLRQAEHAFGDDVFQDFIGAAGDAQARREHVALVERAFERGVLR